MNELKPNNNEIKENANLSSGIEQIEESSVDNIKSSFESKAEKGSEISKSTKNDVSDAEDKIENYAQEDLNDLNDIIMKAETTETSYDPDEIGTIAKQGSSCGSGKGCMGSHSCGGGYTY